MVMVLIVLVMIGVIATYTLSRITTGGNETSQAKARLEAAMSALEAYAGAAQRLPCPVDPLVDTGVENRNPGAAVCLSPEGTIPWQTIGMKREDAYDPWGRKLSYRVYTGNAGSLTQDGGVSMVYCDTDPNPGTGATTPAAGLGGLCTGAGSVYARNTHPNEFLAGKGLNLSDMGVNYTDVAFVVISHGPTGSGGYSVSGAQFGSPANDEKNNTKATGSFTIKAFSEADTAVDSGLHFDDLLAYRRLPDLIARIKLGARDWPELTLTAAGSLLFDAATVGGAAGTGSASPGNLGTATLDFGVATASGMTGSGTAADISYDEIGGYGGLGIAGGGDNRIQSSANEYLRLVSPNSFRKFGVTLSDFGTYGGSVEQVEFRFLLDSTPVLTKHGAGCNIDGGLASFDIDVGTSFNTVEIQPLPATPSGITALLVTEVKGCGASDPDCRTSLDTDANANQCPLSPFP